MISKEEEKKLVLARLETMSDNIKVSIGSEGELSKEDLIEHVKKGDKLGKLVIGMQIKYLRSLKSGL